MKKIILSMIILYSLGIYSNAEVIFRDIYYRNAESFYKDEETLEILNQVFHKDKRYIYWHGNIIKNADPKTFEILDPMYSKDERSVYWATDKIEGADPVTFKIFDLLCMSESDAEDKNYYYYQGEIIDKK